MVTYVLYEHRKVVCCKRLSFPPVQLRRALGRSSSSKIKQSMLAAEKDVQCFSSPGAPEPLCEDEYESSIQ